MKIWQEVDNKVAWEKITDADFYNLFDDNSNMPIVKFDKNDKLEYYPTVVGQHNIKIQAVLENGQIIENTYKAREVKMAFAYHSSMRASYAFFEHQLGFTELDKDTLIRDGVRYAAYYNAETGWSKNPKDQTDFSLEPYLSNFLSLYKNAGLNVLNPSSFAVIHSARDNWIDSGLKKMMDTAWEKFGIKTIVWDEAIFNIPRWYEWTFEQVYEYIDNLYKNENKVMYNYMHHPGFYGINLVDEPLSAKEKGAKRINEIERAGYCCKAISKIAEREKIDCKFACALLKYPYIFKGEVGYLDYLNDWAIYSDADFINFDCYLPSTNSDPNLGSIVTLSTFETTYKCIRQIATKYNMKIDSAITAFDNSNGTGNKRINLHDIRQNVYYAFLYGSNSLNYFVACPFYDDGAIIRTIFGYDGKPTEIYYWVKDANEKWIILNALMDGFKYQDCNVKSEEPLQVVKALWKNNNGDYAHFYINMNTSADISPELVFVYDNERYIYFKRDGSIEDKIADGEVALWPVSGELVIVINKEEKIFNRSKFAPYKII